MRRLQYPIRFRGIRNQNTIPFDLEVSRCALQEGRAWEIAGVEGCFRRHSSVLDEDIVGNEGD